MKRETNRFAQFDSICAFTIPNEILIQLKEKYNQT